MRDCRKLHENNFSPLKISENVIKLCVKMWKTSFTDDVEALRLSLSLSHLWRFTEHAKWGRHDIDEDWRPWEWASTQREKRTQRRTENESLWKNGCSCPIYRFEIFPPYFFFITLTLVANLIHTFSATHQWISRLHSMRHRDPGPFSRCSCQNNLNFHVFSDNLLVAALLPRIFSLLLCPWTFFPRGSTNAGLDADECDGGWDFLWRVEVIGEMNRFLLFLISAILCRDFFFWLFCDVTEKKKMYKNCCGINRIFVWLSFLLASPFFPAFTHSISLLSTSNFNSNREISTLKLFLLHLSFRGLDFRL